MLYVYPQECLKLWVCCMYITLRMCTKQLIAFCSDFQGSTEAYIVPSRGGKVVQATSLGNVEKVQCWAVEKAPSNVEEDGGESADSDADVDARGGADSSDAATPSACAISASPSFIITSSCRAAHDDYQELYRVALPG